MTEDNLRKAAVIVIWRAIPILCNRSCYQPHNGTHVFLDQMGCYCGVKLVDERTTHCTSVHLFRRDRAGTEVVTAFGIFKHSGAKSFSTMAQNTLLEQFYTVNETMVLVTTYQSLTS